MKQQFTENVQTQAFISTGSHLHPTHGHEECKKIQYIVRTISVLHLLKKELLDLEKMFIYQNNYPRWVINQIVEKQQERNNMNNYNIGDSNTNNENCLTNENDSRMSGKQLSFITLPYKGQQGEKVLKSFQDNFTQISNK